MISAIEALHSTRAGPWMGNLPAALNPPGGLP